MVQKRMKMLLTLLLCVVAMVYAQAQPAVPAYFCDFEDVAECAQWYTWKGNSTHSETWRAGRVECFSGSRGMYTSDLTLDSVGNNAHSWAKANGYTVSMYRKMTLSAGVYTVSLDYICPNEYVSVALVQADTLTNLQIKTTTGTAYAAVVQNANIPALTDLRAAGWVHASGTVTIPAGATNYILVVSYRSQGEARNLGAAVDNIEVVKKQTDNTACDYEIKNFALELINGYVQLTWKGNANNYEVRYYDGDTLLVNMPDVSSYATKTTDTCLIPLEYVEDGVYSFMVRAADTDCGSKSAWAYVKNKLIYDPSAHCIDYLNFDATGVQCSYGRGNWGSGSSESLTQTTYGYNDYGYKSDISTHTIHFLPGETDPRTNNQLRTVPEGSFASVRLGTHQRSNGGSEWQMVTYTIHVDSTMGVVLFRYAYVGETGGHSGLEQPHIRLRLKNQNGEFINGATCGDILFTAPTSDADMNVLNRLPATAGWHKGAAGGTYSDGDIYYRDWTTVGLNVRDFMGQDITIEVSNYGCGQSVHYGYCYFVLDCSLGAIKGVTCDEKPRSLKVDEGFNYRWYKPFNPTEPFYDGQNPTLDSLYISPQDTNTYYVDMISKATNCYFTLQASALYRLPEALMGFQHTPSDCENKVTVSDLSSVLYFYPVPGAEDSVQHRAGDFVREVCTWRTASGQSGTTSFAEPLVIPAANEGDTIFATLSVQMREGCMDDTTMVFPVPAIGPTLGETNAYFVYGDSVYFEPSKSWYKDTCTVEVVFPNVAGCDSILTLHVKILSANTITDSATICEGQSINFRGMELREQGTYYDTIRSVVLTENDSLIYEFRLTVLDTLIVSPQNTSSIVCADDASIVIDYSVLHGEAESLTVLFDSLAHVIGLADISLSGLAATGEITIPIDPADGTYRRPGTYTAELTFYDKHECNVQSFPLHYEILFPSSIIFQRWDDVLSVKSPAENGGYEFIAFQWLQDATPLEEQTKSYYYAPDKLNLESTYQVELTDSLGNKFLTCPFSPLPYAGALSVAPNRVRSGESVRITSGIDAYVRIYNVSGLLLKSQQIQAGVTAMPMVGSAGIYLMQIITEEGARSFHISVTE